MQLINHKPKRFFSFGCSFTKYFWSTWPEVIAYDLDVPLYNYGQSGAGNQYISNMISQADSIYNFNEDDLIIVSWTNVSREDRWINGQWITPGNIYSQEIYDKNFVEKWSDPVGYLVRDLSNIKLTKKMLEYKRCQFHFFSICDIAYQFNQYTKISIISENIKPKYERLIEIYKPEIDFILPSFFKVLWNNDVYKNKLKIKESTGYEFFQDSHPYPEEHYNFLTHVFDEHKFADKTLTKINDVQKKFRDFVDAISIKLNKNWAMYELSRELNDNLIDASQIKSSEIIEKI